MNGRMELSEWAYRPERQGLRPRRRGVTRNAWQIIYIQLYSSFNDSKKNENRQQAKNGN